LDANQQPDVTAPDICAYRDKRGALTPTSANRELEVLAHAFQQGVEWGALRFNPCREVRKLKLPRRNRYVADWEFAAVYSVASPRMKVAMDLALLTGLRRGDLLRLTRGDLMDDGILIRPEKTEQSSGKVILIEWSDDLRAAITAAKKLRPQVRQHVIANMQGKPYTPTGFGSIWRTLMLKALKETELQESFRFNDLRAKSASDDTLEAATERLGHTDIRTTKEFYRRRPARVKPLR
jgi:integrase